MFVKSSTLLSCKILSLCERWKRNKEEDEEEKKSKGRKTFNGKAINNDHKCQNIRYPSLKLYLFTFTHHTWSYTIIFHFLLPSFFLSQSHRMRGKQDFPAPKQ